MYTVSYMVRVKWRNLDSYTTVGQTLTPFQQMISGKEGLYWNLVFVCSREVGKEDT